MDRTIQLDILESVINEDYDATRDMIGLLTQDERLMLMGYCRCITDMISFTDWKED